MFFQLRVFAFFFRVKEMTCLRERVEVFFSQESSFFVSL